MILMPDHPNARRDGYVQEHRLVMEQMLGRTLRIGEIVHHRNHIRTDNRPENLLLYSSSSPHMADHGRARRRWTDEELLAVVRAEARKLGRPPYFKELGARPCARTIADRFGTWQKALTLAGL